MPMPSPTYDQAGITVWCGDCLDVLRELPDCSIDAVVTDPPYGLEFMGKEWDGADGFRRSLNPADAGCDNVFGRSSRTSPEYRTASRAQASRAQAGGFSATDGRPSFLGGLNPRCLVCDRWQRGANPCQCETPQYTNERLPRLHVFQEWCQRWATECLRVLKPGGHMLAFGGARTSHRLACGIEDAGFEIRDSIVWLYGSGFPKSLDVSKAIDKAAGAERVIIGTKLGQPGYSLTDGNGDHRTYSRGLGNTGSGEAECSVTAPATPDAEQWQGWGTALKPAHEPIIVARKPLAGTVASNVLTWGTGALNIDGSRVGDDISRADRYNGKAAFGESSDYRLHKREEPWVAHPGRWPANVVLTHSTDCDTTCAPGCPVAELDQQSGQLTSGLMRAGTRPKGARETYGQDAAGGYETTRDTPADSGGASRFFYTAKADSAERVRINGIAHPTVKPLDLMRWLARLVTPPGGTILDPFAGSGTTIEACILEGFQCVTIEKEADYLPLIMQRINRRRDPLAAVQAAKPDDAEPDLFDLLGGTDA